jgi:hypothetical protein
MGDKGVVEKRCYLSTAEEVLLPDRFLNSDCKEVEAPMCLDLLAVSPSPQHNACLKIDRAGADLCWWRTASCAILTVMLSAGSATRAQRPLSGDSSSLTSGRDMAGLHAPQVAWRGRC